MKDKKIKKKELWALSNVSQKNTTIDNVDKTDESASNYDWCK